MNAWLGFGLFALGTGLGALVTTLATHGQIERLKAELLGLVQSQASTPTTPIPTNAIAAEAIHVNEKSAGV